MAKGRAEVDDDGETRAVFIDTSLHTHIVLLVSPSDTFSVLKQKILDEHPKCFPNFGQIKINALKVKRRGYYYHLLDSMLVKTAFYGVTKNWFLSADMSSQTVCALPPSDDHAIIFPGPSETLPALPASAKNFELGIDCNKDDHFEDHSPDGNKMLGLEMPKKFDLSSAQNECKLAEENLNARDLGDAGGKKNKKKRKRTGERDNAGDETGETLEHLSSDFMGKEPPLTENAVRNVDGDDMKATNDVADEASPSIHAKKKHKVVNQDAQEIPLLNAKSFIADSNGVDREPEAVVSKDHQGDVHRSGSVDVNSLPSSEPSKNSRKRKKGKKHPSSELPNLKTSNEKNLIHTEDDVCDASPPAIDAVANLESVPGTNCVQPSALVSEDGVNNPVKDAPAGTELHYQPEGTSVSSPKLVNDEIETYKGPTLRSQTKKTKKTKKGDDDGADRSNAKCSSEMAVIAKNGVAMRENDITIHCQEKFETERMELGTKAKKKKVKRGKVSTMENGDIPSMENNKDTPTNSLSNLHDGVQEEEDARKVSAEAVPLQTSEIKETGVNADIKAEKAKKKTKKKQTASVKESTEVSVKEHSDQKMTETDIPKTALADPVVNGDMAGSKLPVELTENLLEQFNKTADAAASADFAEVRKADKPRASKKKAKKNHLTSSVDTSYSGHNLVTSKKIRGSEATSHDDAKEKDDDAEAECMRHIPTELLQPPSINKSEENAEITSDKPRNRTGKKQTALTDPPMSPMKPQFDNKAREESATKSFDDLSANIIVNDANHQGEVFLGEDNNKQINANHLSESAGLAEVRNHDGPPAIKENVKKLVPPSSINTSSNQPSLRKSKKNKGKPSRSQLRESITDGDQKLDIPMTQLSEKPPETPVEGNQPQAPHADPINSVDEAILHSQTAVARKSDVIGAHSHGNGRLSQASSKSADSPARKTQKAKNAKTPPKKSNENHSGSKKFSSKITGVEGSASVQKKGLLATPGAIFEDESSASSDDREKIDGSDASTRTPSDNLSSSDYSEGESKGDVVTSRHDASKENGQDGTNSTLKNMTLHSILRSSSRFKKAKVVASQSQLEDSEAVDVVPDSQAANQ